MGISHSVVGASCIHYRLPRCQALFHWMLGAELRQARLSVAMTQEKLAVRAKLSREYVSNVERGIHSPMMDVFLRLCRALGVSAAGIVAAIESGQLPRSGAPEPPRVR